MSKSGSSSRSDSVLSLLVFSPDSFWWLFPRNWFLILLVFSFSNADSILFSLWYWKTMLMWLVRVCPCPASFSLYTPVGCWRLMDASRSSPEKLTHRTGTTWTIENSLEIQWLYDLACVAKKVRLIWINWHAFRLLYGPTSQRERQKNWKNGLLMITIDWCLAWLDQKTYILWSLGLRLYVIRQIWIRITQHRKLKHTHR